MAIKEEILGKNFAIYNADCIEVMDSLPSNSIGLSVYSPPFAGLYHYSSDDRDLSNSADKKEFFDHYDFVIKGLARITMPGRITCVHCTDIPASNCGVDHYFDLPGAFIKAYEKHGFHYMGRRAIWNEPLRVRLRTMQKNLSHKGITEDASASGIASSDYVLFFRNAGENKIPVAYPNGLQEYVGERTIPEKFHSYKNYQGKQTENLYSHWIWRNYASSVWDDIRTQRILPFADTKEADDEKHVHPLQLDVIERCIVLYSNPGETVFTPFMGVGSEAYSAVYSGRKAIGAELKASYFRQAVKNLQAIESGVHFEMKNETINFNSEDM